MSPDSLSLYICILTERGDEGPASFHTDTRQNHSTECK